MSAPVPAAACPHCLRKDGTEVYRYHLGDGYEFDVEEARRLVGDGRGPVEVEPESVQKCVEYSRIFESHLDHVNPSAPGLIAHIWYVTEDGETIHGHLLIDGNHRAARCLRDGLPFFAHVLTEAESRAVLLHQPGDGAWDDDP
jgi:hypothetical protein